MFDITIGGRELHLVFDTAAWVDVERVFGSLDKMYKNLDEDVMPITTGLHLAAATATSGTCERKTKDDRITFAWLVKNAKPTEAQQIGHLARLAILKGMERQEEGFEEGPVDSVLEEEQAKKTRADA